MAYDAPPPKNRPEPGYYYHYKHRPEWAAKQLCLLHLWSWASHGR